jgi:hypothetical protein
MKRLRDERIKALDLGESKAADNGDTLNRQSAQHDPSLHPFIF